MKSLLVAAAMVVVGTVTSAQQQAAAVPTLDTYRVGRNDTLKVSVFRRDDLSGDFVVTKEGKINLWGSEIEALGLSLDDLRKKLTDELAKRPNPPQAAVVIQVRRIDGRAATLRR